MLSHSIRELVLNTGIGGYKSWEDCFLGPFTLKSREMAYSNQGFFVDKSRHGHAIWTLGVHPPTSPCPTLLLFYSHTTYLPRTSLDVTSWSWRTYVTLVGKGLISLKPDQQRDFLSTYNCVWLTLPSDLWSSDHETFPSSMGEWVPENDSKMTVHVCMHDKHIHVIIII